MIIKKILSSLALLAVAGSLAACSNIFHDLDMQTGFILPMLPRIEYMFPARNMSGVKLNQPILVSFNKEMDPACLTTDAFEVLDTAEPETRLTIERIDIYMNRIIILTPAPMGTPPPVQLFDYGRDYTVTLVRDLYDQDGYELRDGYSWNFTTAPYDPANPFAAFDLEAPYIIAVTPLPGSLCDIGDMSITATFNEDINPMTISSGNFTLTKDDGTPVPVSGTVSYDIVKNRKGEFEWVATFIPDQPLEKYSRYTASISGVADLAGNVMMTKTWTFRTGAIRVTLENACNMENGFGTFGDADGDGINRIGRVLRTDDGKLLYDLFADGGGIGETYLDSIFDQGSSGEMSPGRFLRIVHGGDNIYSGLGMRPVKRSLFNNIISPPKDQCYIDLMYGLFLLPRPVYWSRCEGNMSITAPEIYADGYIPAINRNGTVYAGGMFGSAAWGKDTALWDNSYTSVYPFGDNVAEFMRSGTISVWWKPVSSLQNLSSIRVTITEKLIIEGSINTWGPVNQVQIIINGDTRPPTAYNLIGNGGWNHLYIIWDPYGFENDRTRRVKVYINGGNVISSSTPFAGSNLLTVGLLSGFNIGSGYSAMDNLKIWNHVVADDPSFEYNEGAGRERALHAIYGRDETDEEYDYRPRLVAPGGVGYYYLP